MQEAKLGGEESWETEEAGLGKWEQERKLGAHLFQHVAGRQQRVKRFALLYLCVGLRGLPGAALGWSGTVPGSNLLVVSPSDLCSCQVAFTGTSELWVPAGGCAPSRGSVNGAKEKGKQLKVPPLILCVL